MLQYKMIFKSYCRKINKSQQRALKISFLQHAQKITLKECKQIIPDGTLGTDNFRLFEFDASKIDKPE